MVGAINVTLYGQPVHGTLPRLILNAVTDVARQIEIDSFHRAYRSHRVISLPAPLKAGAALLAVDREDVTVAGSRAAQTMFGLSQTRLQNGICLSDLLNYPDGNFDQAEYAVLRRFLIRANGNVSEAARMLNISRATIKRKIKAYDLQRASKRELE